MKIVNSFCWDWSEEQSKMLSQVGINVPVGYKRFKIPETSKVFPIVKSYMKSWGVEEDSVFWIRTIEWSKREILSSDYSIILDFPHEGYPMDDDDFGYKQTTYIGEKICPQCDIAHIQKSYFRLEKKPKKRMFKLFWVEDELFISTTDYNKIFKPLGIGFKEVRLFRNDFIIEDVVQLDIPIINEDLPLDKYGYSICPECGKKKYNPLTKLVLDYFPLHKNPLPHIYKGKEWFGAGHRAYKRIFVSRELAIKLLDEKLIRLSCLWPCR